MLRRDSFYPLNGAWEFSLDVAETDQRANVRFDRTIQVPFAPECPLSEVGHDDFIPVCWYRRSFKAPSSQPGERTRLVFEAVDYRCQVWVNDRFVGAHEGGYNRFSFDVTEALNNGDDQQITVRVEDEALDLSQPRGKQDWLREPHGIWYPRTTGIWQSVWLEVVPDVCIEHVVWTPDVASWQIEVSVDFQQSRVTGDADSAGHEPRALRITLMHQGRRLCQDTVWLDADLLREGVNRTLRLPDPGIDDAREKLMWSPRAPRLIDATLELLDEAERVIDRVESYTALRDVRTLRDRLMLNGRPCELRLVLNQGYWSDGGMTAPDDQALRRDVELIKTLGFNGVRMHQKIECERFLYWADTLGLLVWEEMPSVYQFSRRGMDRLVREWTRAVRRDQSHPCIIAWVPVNESWGFPDLPLNQVQQQGVQALFHLTKALDPTRPVISNDGWEMTPTDIIAVHDYQWDPQVIRRRYDRERRTPAQILRDERPGHRVLLLEDGVYNGQPIMLTEFGGIAFSEDEQHTWGYSRASDATDLLRRYAGLLDAVRDNPIFSGFCYTQFTDTYQESNGLLRMDRTPKVDPSLLEIATAGARDQTQRALLEHAIGSGNGSLQLD